MLLNLRCFPGCFQHNQCRGGVTGGHIEIRKYSYSQRFSFLLLLDELHLTLAPAANRQQKPTHYEGETSQWGDVA